MKQPSGSQLLETTAAFLEQRLLPLVLVTAAFGLAWPTPARSAVNHQGINIALVVLVASVGLSLPAEALSQARGEWRRLALAVLGSAIVLPLLAWVCGRIVPDGPLRLGVLAAGVAPTEVAAIGLTVLAGGRAAVSAAVLAGSTVASVVTAGPVLGLLAGARHGFSSTNLLFSLIHIVAIPLVLAALLRARLPARLIPTVTRLSEAIGPLALLVLIWLVAGQVQLSNAFLRSALALACFLAASVGLGWLVSLRLPRERRISLLLPVAMRDFAIAAGIATAAFGPQAAASLGIYGIFVLVLGASAARVGSR